MFPTFPSTSASIEASLKAICLETSHAWKLKCTIWFDIEGLKLHNKTLKKWSVPNLLNYKLLDHSMVTLWSGPFQKAMLRQWCIEITNPRFPEEKETRSNILIIAPLDGQCSVWSEIGFCFITFGATVEYFEIPTVCSFFNCWSTGLELFRLKNFNLWDFFLLEIKDPPVLLLEKFQSLCFEIVKDQLWAEYQTITECHEIHEFKRALNCEKNQWLNCSGKFSVCYIVETVCRGGLTACIVSSKFTASGQFSQQTWHYWH